MKILLLAFVLVLVACGPSIWEPQLYANRVASYTNEEVLDGYNRYNNWFQYNIVGTRCISHQCQYSLRWYYAYKNEALKRELICEDCKLDHNQELRRPSWK